MRVALVQLASFGDCLYATIVARQIKRDHPRSHLTWVIADRFASIIEGNPHVDAIHRIQIGSTADAWSSGYESASHWVREQLQLGKLDKAYYTQILPDNFQHYDGFIRSTIYKGYPGGVLGPHRPDVILNEAEERHVTEYVERHQIKKFKHVFLFECGPKSGQSPMSPARAEALAVALGSRHPEALFLMSSTEALVKPLCNVVDVSCLTYRENAALARHCTGLIGCSSGITWLTTSTTSKSLPMLQILTKSTEIFKYASVAADFRRCGLEESAVIEMADPSDARIISCMQKWLIESHAAARDQFHEEVGLTSVHAENTYWFIRRRRGRLVATRSILRFVITNGLSTVPWRVMSGEICATGGAAIRFLRRRFPWLGIQPDPRKAKHL